MIIFPFFIISNLVALNVRVHPSSHNFAIEMSDFWISLKTCAVVAADDNSGCTKDAVTLLFIFCPFGRPTSMHGAFWFILCIGASVVRKWPVVPVSAIA